VCGCDEVEILARCPQVRKNLWGGELWSDGYFLSTVGQHGSEETIHNYVKGQGQPGQYQQLHAQQPTRSLFDASP
jgi:putative transposase